MSGWKPMRQYGQTLFLIINLLDEFAKKLQAILPKQVHTIDKQTVVEEQTARGASTDLLTGGPTKV